MLSLSDDMMNLYGHSAWERDRDRWVWVYSYEIAERRIP